MLSLDSALPDFQYIVFRDFKNDHIPEILDEVYVKAVYKPFLVGKKDLTIVDLGANQGLTAYYFKDYAKTVYAVEPSKQHIETLNEMIRVNKITNIKICPYAISNKNEKKTFYNTSNRTAFSLTKLEDSGKEEVDAITLKELMKREKIDRIDILKLDIEGEESVVICSDEFAEIAPKIPVILGEWHAWDTQNQQQFQDRFRDLGYDFHWRHDTKAAVFEAIRI